MRLFVLFVFVVFSFSLTETEQLLFSNTLRDGWAVNAYNGDVSVVSFQKKNVIEAQLQNIGGIDLFSRRYTINVSKDNELIVSVYPLADVSLSLWLRTANEVWGTKQMITDLKSNQWNELKFRLKDIKESDGKLVDQLNIERTDSTKEIVTIYFDRIAFLGNEEEESFSDSSLSDSSKSESSSSRKKGTEEEEEESSGTQPLGFSLAIIFLAVLYQFFL